MSLLSSEVKSLSFPFIQCPKCKKFKFKMEIIKGKKKVHKLRIETEDLYEKYDEMKIICDICGKKFKPKVFKEKLCPKCKKKYDTERYYPTQMKDLINWEEFNKK